MFMCPSERPHKGELTLLNSWHVLDFFFHSMKYSLTVPSVLLFYNDIVNTFWKYKINFAIRTGENK